MSINKKEATPNDSNNLNLSSRSKSGEKVNLSAHLNKFDTSIEKKKEQDQVKILKVQARKDYSLLVQKRSKSQEQSVNKQFRT